MNTPNTDKVYQKIATILATHYNFVSLKALDQILSIKEIHIEAQNQELPDEGFNKFNVYAYKQTIKPANFIKCERKE